MMIERILWFDERLNDDFDWTKDIEVYLSLKYMIYASKQYPNKTISFEEVETRLNTLKDKFSFEQQSKMQPEWTRTAFRSKFNHGVQNRT